MWRLIFLVDTGDQTWEFTKQTPRRAPRERRERPTRKNGDVIDVTNKTNKINISFWLVFQYQQYQPAMGYNITREWLFAQNGDLFSPRASWGSRAGLKKGRQRCGRKRPLADSRAQDTSHDPICSRLNQLGDPLWYRFPKIQTVFGALIKMACWVVYAVEMYKVPTGNDGNLEWLLGGAIGGHF
jgi:hypothetical protein